MKKSGEKVALVCLVAIILLFALATVAMASSAGMPWETPMNTILASIQGPVAKIIGVIAIVATGLGLAFGEGGG
jgi:type IV secretion system protein VirB2